MTLALRRAAPDDYDVPGRRDRRAHLPHERGPRALALDDQGCDEELIGAGIDKTFPAANQAVQAGTDSPPELARPLCRKEPT